MSTYSFRQNLAYLGMLVTRPIRLIDCLLQEQNLLYAVVPALVSEILYALVGGLVYLTQAEFNLSINPLARAFHLTRRQMSLVQEITHPFVGLADVFLFAGTVLVVARLIRVKRIDLRSWLLAYVFLWGAFSCLSALVDLVILFPPLGWDLGFLVYIHHLLALASILLLSEFIHRKDTISYSKSAAIAIPGYMVVLASRLLFLP